MSMKVDVFECDVPLSSFRFLFLFYFFFSITKKQRRSVFSVKSAPKRKKEIKIETLKIEVFCFSF